MLLNTLNEKKIGTFSLGSTFSSYFGHHMTIVEGGFVSTNDKDLLLNLERDLKFVIYGQIKI